MRGLAFALIAVTLAAPAAQAQTAELLGPRESPVELFEKEGGNDGAAEIRFSLPAPADVYVKLLAVPGNPVHDGERANGSVAADHSSGTDGWWVSFSLTSQNSSESADLGFFADGTPTRPVPLGAGEHDLVVRVHAPEDDRLGYGGSRILVALGIRPLGGAAPVNATGGMLDDAITIALKPVLEPAPPQQASPSPVPDGGGAGAATPGPSAVLPLGLLLAWIAVGGSRRRRGRAR